MLKIAILGTRGIPNYHGGFEQFAEYLADGMVKMGYDITVYNSSSHPYKENTWRGVKIIHCFDAEDKLGTFGQFIYDLNCILDIRKKKFDIILQLGYTSSSVWNWLLPKKAIITTNMDGLEWKRTKFSPKVQKFLQYAEKLAVKHSNFLIADSIGIKQYLEEKYTVNTDYIPYGADNFTDPDPACLGEYNLKPYDYDMLIARLEPENSIDAILQGVAAANIGRDFLVVGKHATKYGEYLKDKFKDYNWIRFLGGIYDMNILNNVRYYSNIYFHGHTVGGTNPSLLEAMASDALICANDNIFNASILGDDAFYFKNKDDITDILASKSKADYKAFIKNNSAKIEEIYNWNTIINQYEEHFKNIYAVKKASY